MDICVIITEVKVFVKSNQLSKWKYINIKIYDFQICFLKTKNGQLLLHQPQKVQKAILL